MLAGIVILGGSSFAQTDPAKGRVKLHLTKSIPILKGDYENPEIRPAKDKPKPKPKKRSVVRSNSSSIANNRNSNVSVSRSNRKHTCKNIRIIRIIQRYRWDWRTAAAIACQESRFDPGAVNKKSGACGLFQLNPCPTGSTWWNPDTNAEMAFWNKYGGWPNTKPEYLRWSPWTAYTSGAYRKYLYLFR